MALSLLDDGTVDEDATEATARRESAPSGCRGRSRRSCATGPARTSKGPGWRSPATAPSVERIGGHYYFRCACGCCIAPAEENWKPYARQSSAAAAELGPRISLHDELEARRYACPELCAAARRGNQAQIGPAAVRYGPAELGSFAWHRRLFRCRRRGDAISNAAGSSSRAAATTSAATSRQERRTQRSRHRHGA